MSTDEEAKAAMDKLNNSTLDGRTIVVKEARPREEFGSRPGGGGGANFRDRDHKSSRKRY
jgi:RNA recognition motif-containing protein